MKVYKIGDLPFDFITRKQDNEKTVFSTENEQCQFIINTELLNKNTKIVKEENNFSVLQSLTDRLQNIK